MTQNLDSSTQQMAFLQQLVIQIGIKSGLLHQKKSFSMGAKQHCSGQDNKAIQNRYSLDSPNIIPYSFTQLTSQPKKKSMYAALSTGSDRSSPGGMDPQTREMLCRVIAEHFVLGRLDQQQIRQLVDMMEFSEAEAGSYVFHKGEEPDELYIVDSGQVEVEFPDTSKNKRLGRGGIFGELAIVYHCTRLASIKVVEDAQLWHIGEKDLALMFKQVIENRKKANKKYLVGLQLLKFVPQQNRNTLSETFVELIYDANTVIYEDGEESHQVYLLVQGAVEAVYSKKTVNIQPGCYFGDQRICNIPNRVCEVRTVTRARIMSCCISDLRNCLGKDPIALCQVFCLRILLKRFKETVNWIRDIKQEQLDKLIAEAEIVQVQSGDTLTRVTQTDDVYVCFSCGVNAETTGLILNELGKLPEEQTLPTGSLLAKIDGDAIKLALQQNSQMAKLKLENIHLIKKIAEGSFSDVFLARNSRSVSAKDSMLVVKCISKSLISARQLAPSIHNEQTCLSQVDSPFIVKYHGSLKDKHTVYLIMEYIEGFELYDVLKESKILDITVAQFYLCSLLLCAEYLHGHCIIYRDFKPENVIVKQDGYIKLVDLGAAKKLSKFDNFKTHTIIGTPAYMAPEVFTGNAYSYEADLWSIGVMFYEFLTGKLPFGDMTDDPMDISEEIMFRTVDIPAHLFNSPAGALLMQLLSKYPSDRMNNSSFLHLKQHKFFNKFDWAGLESCTLKSPYIPEQKKKNSYFEGILNSFIEKVMPKQRSQSARNPLQEIN